MAIVADERRNLIDFSMHFSLTLFLAAAKKHHDDVLTHPHMLCVHLREIEAIPWFAFRSHLRVKARQV